MNIIKKISMIIVLLGIFIAANAFGDEAFARGGRGGRRQGPPPEAYTACEGKQVGDTAEFVSPRGNTVTGTCEEDGDRMVLRPDRGSQDSEAGSVNASGDETSSRRKGSRRQGPPPEAYSACEDKSAGDVAELVSRRGDTVTGTCEQDGDRLVLRPDRRRKDTDAGVNNTDD